MGSRKAIVKQSAAGDIAAIAWYIESKRFTEQLIVFEII